MKWLKRLWPRNKHEKPWRVVSVDELPEALSRQVVYLVGEGKYKWCISMRCPCACGAVISLSTLAKVRPRWRYSLDGDGMISIWPSIWRTAGCKSHFHLTRGTIIWHREEHRTEQTPLSNAFDVEKLRRWIPMKVRQLWRLAFPSAAGALQPPSHQRRDDRSRM